MNKADLYMKEDINKIFSFGCLDKNPRPKYKDGTPAHTVFTTHNIRSYDLSKDEFPITTLRPIAWKSAVKEMFWLYQDKSSDLELLHQRGVKAWDDWNIGDGTIGFRYGHTVNRWDIFNKRVLEDIRKDPYGRYHICNLWQEQEFEDEPKGLKPCAYETIWSVRGEYLDMLLNQRSGDMLVASGGGGWNEVQYAALLIMVAKHTGYKPGKFTHFVVNEQIYDRQSSQAKELIRRFEEVEKAEFFGNTKSNARLAFMPKSDNFYDFTIDDFTMENYDPIKPNLKFEIGI